MRKPGSTWQDAIYYPLQQKTFEDALDLFLKEECPAMAGSLIRKEFVKALKGIVEKYYPAPSRLRLGQVLWSAVATEDKPHPRKSMKEYRQTPVALSLLTSEELEAMRKGFPIRKLLPKRAVRLFYEAHKQGGVLAMSDVASLLGVSPSTVGRWVEAYEKEHNRNLPCRGSIHDMGTKQSHKAVICRKKYLESKSTQEIALETNHSPECVDRYLFDYNRVKFCLNRKMNLNEIAFSCKLSPNLVKQYLDIINSFNHIIPINPSQKT